MNTYFVPFFSIVLSLAALTLSAPVLAQHMDHDMGGMHAASSSSELVPAEVRAVDAKAHKITLKHGAMAGMPAMTMVYPYQPDLAIAAKLKAGEQIRFHAEEVAGVLTVTSIQR